jgi:LysR family glycine cleavage system transcriptional activator
MRSLEQLEGGFRRLEPYRKPGSVVIYCESDFASRWLLPRLNDLKRAVPACEPWIDTSGKAIDFESLEVSIAIIRGSCPRWWCSSVEQAAREARPLGAP